MANNEEEEDKRIADLYWVALILFVGPFLGGALLSFMTHTEANAVGIISFCGFLMLMYVGARRFQRELHRKKVVKKSLEQA